MANVKKKAPAKKAATKKTAPKKYTLSDKEKNSIWLLFTIVIVIITIIFFYLYHTSGV